MFRLVSNESKVSLCDVVDDFGDSIGREIITSITTVPGLNSFLKAVGSRRVGLCSFCSSNLVVAEVLGA